MRSIERAAYLAWSRQASFRRLVDETIRYIDRAQDHAVSVSWGKDSVVLLHLAASIKQDIVALNARYPNPAERFADMDRVRDEMLARADMGKIAYVEVETPGEWEMYERAGGGFSQAETATQREAVRWWKTSFERAMRSAMLKHGCIGVLLGLRAEESHARRMNIITHGTSYERMDGLRVGLPLARWSGKDVWAYIVMHDLPWLRIYDHASAGRERARSGFVFATGGAGAIRRHGVWEDWRKTYPCEFRAWLQRFPELDK